MTLVELLVVFVIIVILALMVAPQVSKMQEVSWKAVSAHTLRSLSAAGAAYRAEHDGEFWKYREDSRDGVQWWFGFEPVYSLGRKEGDRIIDFAKGPLGQYAIASGGRIASDPAFLASKPRHKPKFKDGNYGYGYNSLLGGGPLGRQRLARGQSFERPGQIVVFATCAQVNDFQRPASKRRPMLEEFYLINDRERTVHFRFNGNALCAMVDGSIRELPMDPSTRDHRMPNANIGRFAPIGDRLHLGE
jgi:hypothetical protein